VFRRSGVSPDDIRTAADLAALPLTSTGDYRMRPLAETLARHARPDSLVERATSGSSGRPFVIRRTVWEDHLINQFRWRAYASFGLRLRDRIAGVRLCTPSHQRGSLLGRARQAVGVRRQHDVNSLASATEILQRLAALRPDAVMGYPSVLAHVASHRLMAGRPVVRPRLIVTGGETLVPFRRERIAAGFGARVFDIYGAHEFNLLAWECSRGGGYHVCDDNVALEILRDGRPAGPGERGEVVATALHCYAMPFLRYQLGDVATRGPEPCPCGQPFSTLRAVEGRMHDYFRMPDGSLLHPDTVVVPIMEAEAPWFDRYRLTQERVDRIVLQILPFERPTPERLARVRQLGAGHLPPGVSFHVEVVERFDADGSGKFRFCRSLVASHLDGIDWARV
jgi:phenylacetate-CoA ligase